jgi:hypothetical protein
MHLADPVVYRSGLNRDGGIAMKFRLFYEGRLLAANGDPRQGQADKMADHKHEIRRAFHKQLKHFWSTNRFLSTHNTWGEMFNHPRDTWMNLPELLVKYVERVHPTLNGFSFVPLVCEEFEISCRLDLLILRRDKPGGIFQSRDLDNRLKVIFDALKMPKNISELGAASPAEDENPLFVLLQEDSLIDHVSVETDELLDPPDMAGRDDSYVRLIVQVTLAPVTATMFNLAFV